MLKIILHWKLFEWVSEFSLVDIQIQSNIVNMTNPEINSSSSKRNNLKEHGAWFINNINKYACPAF